MTRQFSDGIFLPFEIAESRVHLQEMCEGKLIARVCWEVNDEMPDNSAGFGLEFTTSDRLVILALPVSEGAYMSRLVWRWIEAQRIWTKPMTQHFQRDRRQAGEPGADALANQLEGQVIVGVLKPAHHVGLGERMDLELRDGSRLVVESVPILPAVRGGGPGACELEVRREARPRMVSA